MLRVFSWCLGLAFMLVIGCHDSTGPYSGVAVRLEVSESQAAVGDAVTLRAIATNHGEQTYRAGVSCGEGLDFMIRSPNGAQRLLLRGVASFCDLKDSNILNAGETDTVTAQWVIPGPAGVYQIRAGVSAETGIAVLSVPVSITVE